MGADQEILAFWFTEAGPKKWYMKSDAFDAEIRARFEILAIDLAATTYKGLHAWEDKPESTLALIIALDQFSRNMYRDTPAAFAWDPIARGVTRRMMTKRWDLKVPQARRAFVYMPLMHSEDIKDQDTCVSVMTSRLEGESNLRHAVAHKQVIEQFGRFPHRNTILGRESTKAEIDFLKNGGYAP